MRRILCGGDALGIACRVRSEGPRRVGFAQERDPRRGFFPGSVAGGLSGFFYPDAPVHVTEYVVFLNITAWESKHRSTLGKVTSKVSDRPLQIASILSFATLGLSIPLI